MKTFNEFVEENRTDRIHEDAIKRWNERVIPRHLHEMGENGAELYLERHGNRIGARKCIHLANKAEVEGCREMALGFWRKAYELETGTKPDMQEIATLPEANGLKQVDTSDGQEVWIPPQLIEIADQVKRGGLRRQETVRNLLGWFNLPRRSVWASHTVKSALASLDIETDPNFEYAYLDGLVEFLPMNKETGNDTKVTGTEQPANFQKTATEDEAPSNGTESGIKSTSPFIDPTYRIGKLASANKPPISVKLATDIKEAISLMLMHDFSQIPIMETEREVKGVISWTSIGSRLALGRSFTQVKDFREDHFEISADVSLFSAIDAIIEHEYVLVRDSTKKITGIVTTSDLSNQFRQLGEPFLLLGEIENHLRRLIQGKFTVAEFQTAKDSTDSGRSISSVYDLTFGEYVRFLENEANWSKLNVLLDRKVFIKRLDEIRLIRNDVMHFDPDGVAEADLYKLREFVRFLQGLVVKGVV